VPGRCSPESRRASTASDFRCASAVGLLPSHFLNLSREVALPALLLNFLFAVFAAWTLGHAKVDRHGRDQNHHDDRPRGEADDMENLPRLMELGPALDDAVLAAAAESLPGLAVKLMSELSGPSTAPENGSISMTSRLR
jgi:hypothetical protein